MHNLLSNTLIAENYERRIQVEKLTPIGRAYFKNYEHKKLDEKTVILVKPKNLSIDKSGKVVKKGKQSKKK